MGDRRFDGLTLSFSMARHRNALSVDGFACFRKRCISEKEEASFALQSLVEQLRLPRLREVTLCFGCFAMEKKRVVSRKDYRASEIVPGENEFLQAFAYDEANDLPRAIRWYRRAALKKHTSAMLNLGNIMDSLPSEENRKEAIYWYKLAIQHGNRSGAWNLAMLYRNRRIRRWYLHWLHRAAELGDEDAVATLRKIERARRRPKQSA